MSIALGRCCAQVPGVPEAGGRPWQHWLTSCLWQMGQPLLLGLSHSRFLSKNLHLPGLGELRRHGQ